MQNVRSDRYAQKERQKLHNFNELEKQLAEELRRLERKETSGSGVRSAMLEQERLDNRFRQHLSELMAEHDLKANVVREILMAYHDIGIER